MVGYKLSSSQLSRPPVARAIKELASNGSGKLTLLTNTTIFISDK